MIKFHLAPLPEILLYSSSTYLSARRYKPSYEDFRADYKATVVKNYNIPSCTTSRNLFYSSSTHLSARRHKLSLEDFRAAYMAPFVKNRQNSVLCASIFFLVVTPAIAILQADPQRPSESRSHVLTHPRPLVYRKVSVQQDKFRKV